MAFTSIGSLGLANNTANDQSSTSVTLSAQADAGNLAVVAVAVDNNQTTDGDEGAVSSITDSAGGNTWSKGAEYTNGQGAAQAGTTISLWYSVIANSIPATGSITANFTNSTSRDASVIQAWEYSIAGGNSVAVEGTPGTQAVDGGDAAALDVTTANIECLRVRAIAVETNTTTAMTATTGWTRWSTSTSRVADKGSQTGSMLLDVEFIISTGTGSSSDPTLGTTVRDNSSVYVAFKETTAPTVIPTRMLLGVGV